MFLKDLFIKNQLSKYDSFIWDSKVKKIKNIQSLNFINKAGLGSSIFSEVDSNPTEINAAAGIKKECIYFAFNLL